MTFRCSVTGGVFTVWRGSLLVDCDEITLRHVDFDDNAITLICGNGKAVGISSGGDYNVSELTLTAISAMNRGYIQCDADDGMNVESIGNSTLNYSNSKYKAYTELHTLVLYYN